MMNIPTNLYPEIFPRLNIAEIDVVEGAAGPGRRMVAWLQGCLKRCPGCANGPFLTRRESQLFSVEELLEKISAQDGIDGITLSGGEPLLQAEALTPFLEEVHSKGLNIVSYSGYTLEELQAQHKAAIDAFLQHIDLLIDGEYQQALPRAGAYRPSSNQRLHFLSNRISPEDCREVVETAFSISGGEATITGTLPPEIRKEFFALLRAEGVRWKGRSKL